MKIRKPATDFSKLVVIRKNRFAKVNEAPQPVPLPTNNYDKSFVEFIKEQEEKIKRAVLDQKM